MVKKEQPSGEESCIPKDASVWEQAFENECREGGLLSGVSGPVSPNHVLEELRLARDASLKAQAEVRALKQQLARAASETATRFRDELLLREELHAARSASEPNVLQLKQLLLEPAVNREFSRLSMRLEAVQRERDALQEELRVIQMSLVSNDPKAPNAMAQQVRQLEERCEALGHEAIESRVELLEKSLTIARKQLEDMRRQYGELEDHAHSLDDEAEVLQRELIALRRALSQGQPGGPNRPMEAWEDRRGPIPPPDRSRKGGNSPPQPPFRKRMRD